MVRDGQVALRTSRAAVEIHGGCVASRTEPLGRSMLLSIVAERNNLEGETAWHWHIGHARVMRYFVWSLPHGWNRSAGQIITPGHGGPCE